MIRSASANRIFWGPSAPLPYAAIASTILPTKLRSSGTGRLKARGLIAAPYHHVRRGLDFRHFIAVDQLLVPGKIQNFRSRRACCCANRKQHGIAKPPAHQHDGFIGRNLGGRPRGSHQYHRIARFELRAQIRRSAHLQSDQRYQSPRTTSTDAPVRAIPSIASFVSPAVVASVAKFWKR